MTIWVTSIMYTIILIIHPLMYKRLRARTLDYMPEYYLLGRMAVGFCRGLIYPYSASVYVTRVEGLAICWPVVSA